MFDTQTTLENLDTAHIATIFEGVVTPYFDKVEFVFPKSEFQQLFNYFLLPMKESKDEVISKYPIVVKNPRSGQSLRNTAKLSDASFGTVQKVKKLLACYR